MHALPASDASEQTAQTRSSRNRDLRGGKRAEVFGASVAQVFGASDWRKCQRKCGAIGFMFNRGLSWVIVGFRVYGLRFRVEG